MILVIEGPPVTKKNHGQIIHSGPKCVACKRGTGRPFMLPSSVFKTWEKGAMGQVAAQLRAGAATCNPSLDDDFVEELLSEWHVGPDEAREIAKLLEAWGEEPNGGRTREDRRREKRELIETYLVAKRAS